MGDPDDDQNQIGHKNTEFVPTSVENVGTKMHLEKLDTNDQPMQECEGCFLQMRETNWHKDDKPYCAQCIKFRVYQECVRKFVLEYDNEETRDDLWPWYENNKNVSDNLQYKAVLDMYSDQVLNIGTILESNLKYYVPRAQTIHAAKLRAGNAKQIKQELSENLHESEEIRKL